MLSAGSLTVLPTVRFSSATIVSFTAVANTPRSVPTGDANVNDFLAGRNIGEAQGVSGALSHIETRDPGDGVGRRLPSPR
jgi:hypothetical protein